jgi:hypothetical protein
VNSNAVGMAQKLLLFWRKPARRCWWEGVELNDVEGVDGPLKVWIRRVWTLEMVSRLGPLRLSPFAMMKTKLMPFSERDWPALTISICFPLWAEFAVRVSCYFI